MPTLEHNAIVEMFRESPDLAPHFLALLFHLDLPSHTATAVVEATIDQLIPVEFRADLVIELRDAGGSLVLVIVLEVQRGRDPSKKLSWPVYVTSVRARTRCPTVVLVVAPDAEVAAWASQPIDLGLGLATMRPVVLGPASVPEVTDPAVAEQESELAVLSALAHGNGENGMAVVQAALVALGRFDRDHAAVYFQVIWNMLREPLRRALETLVMEPLTEDQVRHLPAIERLIELGRLKGLREGELKGLREALLRLVARAGLTLTESDRARIDACEDPATLDTWLENVLGAKSSLDVLC